MSEALSNMTKRAKDQMLCLLSPTNSPTDTGVFNREFERWQQHISDHLLNRDSPVSDYSDATQSELLEAARQHAASYQRPTNSPRWVTITHPFYVFLTDADSLTKLKSIYDAERYLDLLISLLTSGIQRQRANIVVFETLHHYAAATSRLLEQGIIDRVIFTEYDHGRPLDSSELGGNRAYYSCGGYNGKCFKSSLGAIWHATRDVSRMAVIGNLVLESPYGGRARLVPTAREIVWPYGIPERGKFILLRDLYGILNMETT